jgi:hypothetical protein
MDSYVFAAVAILFVALVGGLTAPRPRLRLRRRL